MARKRASALFALSAPLAAAAAFTLSFAACAYILPASWRSFRADPDDAAPAITRALDALGVSVETFDQPNHRIVTSWESSPGGALRTRERYLISWERDAQEASLTVYVRHEAQEQEIGEGGTDRWGTVYHDDRREGLMLDRIQKELASG